MPLTEELRSHPTAGQWWWAVALTTTVAGMVLLAWSWGKWLNPIVDFGRELYVPWQILSGKLLYRDLAYFNGPLSPYLNAAGLSLLGVSLRALVILNTVVLAGVVALLVFLISRFADPVTTLAAGLVFLVCFAFADPTGAGTYNFIAPYSHEMTHGFLLALIALALLFRFLRQPSTRVLIATGMATGLVFLTKSEFFIAVAPVVILGVLLTLRVDTTPRLRAAGQLATLVLAAAAPLMFAYLMLLAASSPTIAWRGVMGPWPHALSSDLHELKFYRGGMGLLDPIRSLELMAGWLLIGVAFFLPLWWVARRTPPNGRHRSWVTIALASLSTVATFLILSQLSVLDLARPMPVVLIVLATLLAMRLMRRRRRSSAFVTESTAMLACLFALLLLTKILLRVRLSHYGFVLAAPAVLILLVLLLDALPTRIARRGGHGTAFRAAAYGFIGVVALTHLLHSAAAYRAKTFTIGEGADAFLADQAADVFAPTLARLRQLVQPGDTLAVLPEGVMLNYLLRVPNPTPYFNFMPPELVMFGERRIVESFRRDPPRFVVMTNRGASEYGYEFLGRGYGEELADWVRDHYQLLEQISPPMADDQGTLGWTMILQRQTD